MLREAFILALFHGLGEGTPGRGVTCLPLKQVSLDIPDLTKTAPEKWTVYCVIKGHIFTVLRGQEEFRTANHSDYLREGREEVRNRSVLQTEEALAETLGGAPVQDARQLWRAKNTGWKTVQT